MTMLLGYRHIKLKHNVMRKLKPPQMNSLFGNIFIRIVPDRWWCNAFGQIIAQRNESLCVFVQICLLDVFTLVECKPWTSDRWFWQRSLLMVPFSWEKICIYLFIMAGFITATQPLNGSFINQMWQSYTVHFKHKHNIMPFHSWLVKH